MTTTTYLIITKSGAECLVSADSAEQANAEWSADPDAEPHCTHLTRLAADDEIEFIELDGMHDYR